MNIDLLQKCYNCHAFDWDKANIEKSWHKHSVNWQEIEQIFFNEPLLVHNDIKHSNDEERFFALGHTDKQRTLMVVFTIRENFIRVISARPMSRKERKNYAHAKEKYQS